MKKAIVAFLFVGLLSITMSSCKSHEKCPAYSKVDSQDLSEFQASNV